MTKLRSKGQRNRNLQQSYVGPVAAYITRDEPGFLTLSTLKWTEPQLPQHCISADGIGHVYVIVNLKQRLQVGIYVGWTVKNIIERFYQHAYKSITNKLHREVQLRRRLLQYGVQHFIIMGLEQVNSAATNGTYKIHQLREQYWQSKLHVVTYNLQCITNEMT
eukprot:8248-Heterococcus_DN1.PRE.1